MDFPPPYTQFAAAWAERFIGNSALNVREESRNLTLKVHMVDKVSSMITGAKARCRRAWWQNSPAKEAKSWSKCRGVCIVSVVHSHHAVITA